ncbi:IS3 family transposase [Corynebacterium diphtheriae bv. gravis]|uniref:IS3 family transposase n=1 Tax=Corynebacterium diphtheriae TaxID=1717 RepID=UPI0009C0FC5A|nr:IS3 family transposase [Corynebacterium diphtheriae]MBG9249293.1 IS3 family transposase [Corynebacterium diphtheriae bv. gravis]OSQ17024.1 transposase [Corynebacterium diphtheriae]UJL50127.1 hypothetical protein FE382_10015 [Corynebacterium diphtheriae]
MARLLKISRSGYYKWPHTQDQQAAGNDEREAYMAEVDHKIRQIFNDSECVYSSPRITAELACRYRITLNRKTVAKRMRLMGLEGISPRMFAPGEGWLYLCVVRDSHSRRVLGWAMDSVHNTDLVERALRMACTLRRGGATGGVLAQRCVAEGHCWHQRDHRRRLRRMVGEGRCRG